MESRRSDLESMDTSGQYENKTNFKKDPDELTKEVYIIKQEVELESVDSVRKEADVSLDKTKIKQEVDLESVDFVRKEADIDQEENVVIYKSSFVEEEHSPVQDSLVANEDIKQDIIEFGEYKINDIENDSIDSVGEQTFENRNPESAQETDASNGLEKTDCSSEVEPLGGKSKEECEHCGKTFRYQYRLALHRIKKHGSTETPTKTRLAPTKTLPRNFPCDKCDKSYHLQLNLEFHRAKVHGLGEAPTKGSTLLNHTCRHCEKLFTGWISLVYHMKHTHGETIDESQCVRCESCSKKFPNASDMIGHVCLKNTVCERERPFKCDLCDKTYFKKTDLEYHYSVHPEYQNIKCDQCSKGFYRESDLRIHKRKVHVTKDSYIECETCNKQFKNQDSLNNHRKLHTDREFCCDLCGKKFKTRKLIQSHMHHKHANRDEELIPCTICGKKLKTKVGFELHLRIHNNDRRFKCAFPSCAKTFFASGCLKKHEQTHTKIKKT